MLEAQTTTTQSRNRYGALLTENQAAEAVLSDLIKREQIEAPYCDFDRKGRGASLNYDLYAFDPATGLAVWQARQAFRRAARHYLSVRKTYALAGRNEDGTPFWHPIPANVVHHHLGSLDGAVKAAMAWIFEIKPEQLGAIKRQGDVALVPMKRAPRGEKVEAGEIILADSHRLTADEIRRDGERVYALNPHLTHLRNQHADVSGSGWFRVAVGRTGRAWDFSPRSVD